MSGTKSSALTARSGGRPDADARAGTFDFDHLVARCDELGATTHEARAKLAGIPLRTYYRLKRRGTSLRLEKLALVAARLGTTTFRLMGDKR